MMDSFKKLIFFVRLDVPCRVLTHDDVPSHPFEDGVAAVDDILFHQKFKHFLGRRRHILKAMAKRDHGKAHINGIYIKSS